jgi:ribonucleoside-diphosphate reductase beta chain
MPTEISMQEDIQQWKGGDISPDEKLLVKRCLGFFAGSESLVGNNLLLSAFKYVTDPECRQYILRQAYEESLHNLTIVYICDSLDLDIDEVFRAYETVPSIKAKDDFLMEITTDLTRNDFSTNTQEGKKELLKNLFTYYIICEGTFFFSGFAMLLALGRQNKLQGISDQIKYTLRDESLHIEFGTYLINTLIEQNPKIWTKAIREEFTEHMKTTVELEVAYAKEVLPTGILGLNADMFVDYMHYIGNRRMAAIGLDYRFPSDSNPFPWLSEVVDTQAMTNFFERRVREYQQGGALEDDF